MIGKFKDILFFPTAYYFAFFAKIRFKIWNPRVIVITGSSGKTTLFSLVESQLKDKAHFSHHANSAIGIPFDILGLHRKTLVLSEWIRLIIKAPFQVFKKAYKEEIYVAECDADRPGEGKFLANFLRPEVTLWVSTSLTHSMNFEKLTPERFRTVEDAIAYEFGYFMQKSRKLVVINAESTLMKNQAQRTKAEVIEVSLKTLDKYQVSERGTEFKSENKTYKFKQILPKEIFYSIEMCKVLCDYIGIEFDPKFKDLKLPPARSSIFKGIKDTTIIDSTYNADFSSMKVILNMFNDFPAKTKWLVLGDMLEQGGLEKQEHEKLARLILGMKDIKRIVLLGPRVKKYTYPILIEEQKEILINVFENPKEVLDLILENLMGGETILFKGARFLEGVIENLLKDKAEAKLLARREIAWEKRRKKWGL